MEPIREGCKVLSENKSSERDKHIPKNGNITMNKTYFLPIITYCSEVLSIRKKEWSRLQGSEIRFIRSFKGKTRWGRNRSEELNRNNRRKFKEKVEITRLSSFGTLKNRRRWDTKKNGKACIPWE